MLIWAALHPLFFVPILPNLVHDRRDDWEPTLIDRTPESPLSNFLHDQSNEIWWSKPAPPYSSGMYGPNAPISASVYELLGEFCFWAYSSMIGGDTSRFTHSRAESRTTFAHRSINRQVNNNRALGTNLASLPFFEYDKSKWKFRMGKRLLYRFRWSFWLIIHNCQAHQKL